MIKHAHQHSIFFPHRFWDQRLALLKKFGKSPTINYFSVSIYLFRFMTWFLILKDKVYTQTFWNIFIIVLIFWKHAFWTMSQHFYKIKQTTKIYMQYIVPDSRSTFYVMVILICVFIMLSLLIIVHFFDYYYLLWPLALSVVVFVYSNMFIKYAV